MDLIVDLFNDNEQLAQRRVLAANDAVNRATLILRYEEGVQRALRDARSNFSSQVGDGAVTHAIDYVRRELARYTDIHSRQDEGTFEHATFRGMIDGFNQALHIFQGVQVPTA